MGYGDIRGSTEEISVSPDELDEIIAMLRCWYSIEVDRWINSEASKYTLKARISNFRRNRSGHNLFDYYRSVVTEAAEMEKSMELSVLVESKDGLVDFIGTRVDFHEDPAGQFQRDVIELRRAAETCRIDVPVRNWLLFTEEEMYSDCTLDIDILFEPFGTIEVKNELSLHLRIGEDKKPAITGFGSSRKRFTYFGFIRNGLQIYQDIKKRVMNRYKQERSAGSGEPESPDLFMFACEDEEEAFVLDSLSKTLGIETMLRKNNVLFKNDLREIPGLISYFWIGLPQAVFAVAE